MLYQMLSGRLPFQGANMVQLSRSIERDEPALGQERKELLIGMNAVDCRHLSGLTSIKQ